VSILALLLGQYLLGGLIRHRGWGLHEHLGLGFGVLALVFANAIVAGSTTSGWVRRSAWLLLLLTLLQVGLGLGTWVLKFGFTPTGYVAVADSIPQIALRTAHTVWGIIVFMAATVHCLKVFRIDSVTPPRSAESIPILRDPSAFIAQGGAG
jgi:hypothetical protein